MSGDVRALELEATTARLGDVVEFLNNGAREANLPPERLEELNLVVEELFMNVCNHAYPEAELGTVTVSYSIPACGELKVEIADRGVEFNPLEIPAPDIRSDLEHRPIGGLGILLVKKLASSLIYRRESDWNRLTFVISSGS